MPPTPPDRLDELGARLDEAKRRHAPEPRQVAGRAMGQGFRLGLELVSGTIVGALIGWGLDRVFGTSPVLLLVFFFMGTAAGFMNLWRAVRREQAIVDAEAAADTER